MSAPISPGSSGGPLISKESEKIIAINSAESLEDTSIGFSIPLYLVSDLIQKWIDTPMTEAAIKEQFYAVNGELYFGNQWNLEGGYFEGGDFTEEDDYFDYWEYDYHDYWDEFGSDLWEYDLNESYDDEGDYDNQYNEDDGYEDWYNDEYDEDDWYDEDYEGYEDDLNEEEEDYTDDEDWYNEDYDDDEDWYNEDYDEDEYDEWDGYEYDEDSEE